jgi:thiosulfate/3-mercaptopyruvate sulfurtransferase
MRRPSRAATSAVSPDGSLLLDAEQLQKRLGNRADLARCPRLAALRGEVEPIDPIAGHIPGAQCAAFTDNLAATGVSCRPDQLKQRFAAKLAAARRPSWWRIAGPG